MTGFDMNTLKILANGSLVQDESMTLGSFNMLSLDITLESSPEHFNFQNLHQNKKCEVNNDVCNSYLGSMLGFKRIQETSFMEEFRKVKSVNYPQTNISVGDRCEIELADHKLHRGVVKFFGRLKCSKGFWVGIELDDAYGSCDGSLCGEKYFDCNIGHGVFSMPSRVKVGDFPPF